MYVAWAGGWILVVCLVSLLRARRSKFERNINHRYRAIKSRGYRNVRCQCVCFDIKTHKTHFNIGRRAENAWASKDAWQLRGVGVHPKDGPTDGQQQQRADKSAFFQTEVGRSVRARECAPLIAICAAESKVSNSRQHLNVIAFKLNYAKAPLPRVMKSVQISCTGRTPRWLRPH